MEFWLIMFIVGIACLGLVFRVKRIFYSSVSRKGSCSSCGGGCSFCANKIMDFWR
ncbi:hypothetical protein [Desulfonauticus submarinus]|uniref:hypothetical protein n=1 Tax=Desulfonauticus submarinus TaxID=206665 RepID=UPI0013565CB8|nr:hypothetical protein [Desulfonauticus submarinus]